MGSPGRSPCRETWGTPKGIPQGVPWGVPWGPPGRGYTLGVLLGGPWGIPWTAWCIDWAFLNDGPKRLGTLYTILLVNMNSLNRKHEHLPERHPGIPQNIASAPPRSSLGDLFCSVLWRYETALEDPSLQNVTSLSQADHLCLGGTGRGRWEGSTRGGSPNIVCDILHSKHVTEVGIMFMQSAKC